MSSILSIDIDEADQEKKKKISSSMLLANLITNV